MSASTATSHQANDRQVGGQHYKTGDLEHWDLFGIEYLNGCATKYVSRHMSKHGREDLEKAIHYCEKAAEVKGDRTITNTLATTRLLEWARGTRMGAREIEICHEILCNTRYDRAVQLLHLLIRQCYPDTLTGAAAYRRAIQEGCEAVNAAIAKENMFPFKPNGPPGFEGTKPGTPEDGGHHARQPLDHADHNSFVADADEGEAIRNWGPEDILGKRLPPSLSPHEWQHRCTEGVQSCYEYDVSAARYLIKDDCREVTHHCTAQD